MKSASFLSIKSVSYSIYFDVFSIFYWIVASYVFMASVYGPDNNFSSFLSWLYKRICLFFIFSNLYFFLLSSIRLKSSVISTFLYFLYLVVGVFLIVAPASTVRNSTTLYFNLFLNVFCINILLVSFNIMLSS